MVITDNTTSDITRHGIIMVAFTAIGAAVNYGYQLVLGWLLSPEDYGIVISLVSLLLIVSVFALTVDTTVTRYVAREAFYSNLNKVHHLWKFFQKRTFALGLIAFMVLAAFTPLISRFLATGGIWNPIVLFLSLIFIFPIYSNFGVIRGLQRFVQLGLNGLLWAVLKLVIAAVLVLLGLRVWGALLAFTVAYIIVFGVTTYCLKDVASAGQEKAAADDYSSYIGLTFLALLTYSVLTNVDVILAKHYLSAVDAGNYAAISVMGKVALYAPSGVAIAMFPKTSQLFGGGQNHDNVLWKSLLLTLLLVGSVVVIYWLFPRFVINILFLGRYPDTTPYLFKYSLNMSFFAFVNLLMFYLLSINKTRVAYFLLAAVLLQLGLIVFWHASVAQIVNIMLISSSVSVVLVFLYYMVVRNAINHNTST